MILESALAFLHISAILAMVVFITSEAALCRPEWMSPAIVQRLVIVDRIYGIAAGAVFVTGLLRVFLGAKGAAWYAGNWLFWTKVGLFAVAGLLSIAPTLRFLRWRKSLAASGALPAAAEVIATRKLVMAQAHVIPVVPLAAVFLARGFGS